MQHFAKHLVPGGKNKSEIAKEGALKSKQPEFIIGIVTSAGHPRNVMIPSRPGIFNPLTILGPMTPIFRLSQGDQIILEKTQRRGNNDAIWPPTIYCDEPALKRMEVTLRGDGITLWRKDGRPMDSKGGRTTEPKMDGAIGDAMGSSSNTNWTRGAVKHATNVTS